MKKGIFAVILILICIVIIAILGSKLNIKDTYVRSSDNLVDNSNKVQNNMNTKMENEINNDIENEFNNTINSEINNDIEKDKNNNINSDIDNIQNEEKNSSLPNDTGLTVKGIPKTINQDITAIANIAYLLGCENITESTNFEDYINSNMPKNGIFISDVTGYKKSDDPYDFIKERTEIMKEKLLAINLEYDINEENYLIENNGISELEQKINSLISSEKKIIIAFIPEYYVYINDIENGLGFGGFHYLNYVSTKPYNNIYTFICDCNHMDEEDFYNMIVEMCELID